MGHVFSDMEILKWNGGRKRLFWFQLGHVFSDMEIYKKCTILRITISGFQLGHVFSDMEMMGDGMTILSEETFQLGHVFSDMEIAAYFSRSLLLTEC